MHKNAPPRQKSDKLALKLTREIRDMPTCIFSNHQHLTQMGLRSGMTLESVLISALLLADLAVPSKTLETFRFHRIRDGFRCSGCMVQVYQF
jgi:hypothetical protein